MNFNSRLAAIHLVMSVLNRGGELTAVDDSVVRPYTDTSGEKRFALLQSIDLTYDFEDEPDDDDIESLRIIREQRQGKNKDIFLTLYDSHDVRTIAAAFVSHAGVDTATQNSWKWIKENFGAGLPTAG